MFLNQLFVIRKKNDKHLDNYEIMQPNVIILPMKDTVYGNSRPTGDGKTQRLNWPNHRFDEVEVV